MRWAEVASRLELGAAQHAALRAVLGQMQRDFDAECGRNWAGQAVSPLDMLAHEIVQRQLDDEKAGKYLLALLQEPDEVGAVRLESVGAIERRARRKAEALLDERQLKVWTALAPASLLDIDIGEHPLSESIRRKVERLQRPEGFLCTSPFEYAHLQSNGDVYPCCPSKFGKVIGNLRRESLEEIWSSAAAAEVRESMVDGSYRYCNAQACEYLREARSSGKTMSPAALVEWAGGQGLTLPRSSPRVVNFAFDKSCNLSCSYCRETTFRASSEELTVIHDIDANVFSAALEGTERIILLGEGDPFASPFYREKLQRYAWARHPKLRIKIQTNGLLLTPSMWASMGASHGAVDWISVSVDAATPETYHLNRKGDFGLLVENLEFIAGLFADGEIRHFHINFLVQANNFREIPGFARLGKRLGCDLIEFQRLENWGTYTEAEYRERAVQENWHPEHEDLLEVLRSEELDHPKVWLLKLGDCVEEKKGVSVISYDNCS